MAKRLFISCPTVGRSKEAIRGTCIYLKRIAEAVFNEDELEVVTPFTEEEISDYIEEAKNFPISVSGWRVIALENSDYYIGISMRHYPIQDPSSLDENAARLFKIPSFFVYPTYLKDFDEIKSYSDKTKEMTEEE